MQPERTIYVVDDDSDVRRSLDLMLRVNGFTVRTFESGPDFLAAVETFEPGILLLDLRMEPLDGLQVLGELAARRLNWPAIVMTGHGEPEVGREVIAAGAAAFLEKPFDEALLLRCLAEA